MANCNVLIKVLNISDEVEIVNEAGELTGFEEWKQESMATTEEVAHMTEQLLGETMKTNKESPCMKRVQKPEVLMNREKVTHCVKRSVSENNINKFHQRPKPREIKTIIDNSLKCLVNDRDGQSLSVTNPVLQTHEKKDNSNGQTAESFLTIPEKFLQRQLNHNQTIEKHTDMRWLSSDKSTNESMKRKICVPETLEDKSEHVSYGGKKLLPSYIRNPCEARHHAEQTQEIQSQTEEFGIKKQNETILKYILSNSDQVEERYIEPVAESQELDMERVEAWALDSSFPVTENEFNINGQPVERWEHTMDGGVIYHEPKNCLVKSLREERKQWVGERVLNILTKDKQKPLCSLERRKSWLPPSEEERRRQIRKKFKKRKVNEALSSADVQSLQQWKEARW